MRAAALFAAISAENDVREAWLGLATARRRLGDAAGAAVALAAALRRHVPDPGFAALADAIAREAGAPGWCGLSGDGAVTVRPTPGNAGTRAPPPDPLPQGEGEDLGHRARRPPFPGQPDRRGGDHRGRRLCERARMAA